MRAKPDLVFEGRPAMYRYFGEAWVLNAECAWEPAHSSIVMMEAAIVGQAEIARRFGRLPALPGEAFS